MPDVAPSPRDRMLFPNIEELLRKAEACAKAAKDFDALGIILGRHRIAIDVRSIWSAYTSGLSIRSAASKSGFSRTMVHRILDRLLSGKCLYTANCPLHNKEVCDFIGFKSTARAEAQAEANKILTSYLALPCADCGVSFPTCAMDFPKKDGEKHSIWLNAGLVVNQARLPAFAEEAKNHAALCLNCIAIRNHAKEPNKKYYVAGFSNLFGNTRSHSRKKI